MSRTIDVQGAVLAVLSSITYSENFAATGFGTIQRTGGRRSLSLQVVGDAVAASTWDVRLDGSNDGVSWTQILQHTTGAGDGTVVATGAALNVVRFIRVNVAGLTLGGATSIDVFVGLV